MFVVLARDFELKETDFIQPYKVRHYLIAFIHSICLFHSAPL